MHSHTPSPIDAQERARRQASIDHARGSVRLEGVVLPPPVEQINQRFIDGALSRQKHIAAIAAWCSEGVDATNPQGRELHDGAMSFARIAELDDAPVQGRFDAAHLQELHRRIFQDLPHLSPGQWRALAPGYVKARALEVSGHRYHVHYASQGAANQASQGATLEARLQQVLEAFDPQALQGLETAPFCQRMARLYGDLDYLHPFKEGNSRTLRAFTTQLAHAAGFALDWHTAQADAARRDRLYIARDREVLQRAFPGLDEARAMQTDSRDEYEAWVRFLAPMARADTLLTLIEESTRPL